MDGAPLPFSSARRNSRVPKMLPHRFFPDAAFCVWVDAKLQLNARPEEAVERFLASASADVAAVRNLRRDTIDHEYGWICSWLCPPSWAPRPASVPDDACAAVRAQWATYEREQPAEGGWMAHTAVIEGALLLLDLRSRATQCFLCNWFNEYVRFGERDQLSFAYVSFAQRPRPRLNLLPRRYHWSVTVEEDTADCYNATPQDAQQLAMRFQHAITRAARPSSAVRVRPRRAGG